jgi:uncharacterized protein (DUF1800 family)
MIHRGADVHKASGSDAAPKSAWRNWRIAGCLVLAAVMASCGGGSGGASDPGVSPPPPSAGASDPGVSPPPASGAPEKPASRAEAARFLTQATFGPTDAEVDHLMSVGYSAWIDEQFAKPASSNLALWDAKATANNATVNTAQDGTTHAFWRNAISGDDQLRQRVAYSLSQIFVISMGDANVDARGAAGFLDMLGDKGLGNYRDLIQAVSKHPQMLAYLTALKNQKADPTTGRVPDENYAREVMQLMSIGLHMLNPDGSEQLNAGQPIDTYGQADIGGMARVFTGWSYACPAWPDSSCFFLGEKAGVGDPDRRIKPVLGYPLYHSTEEKKFLGVTIPAQGTGDPDASLKVALDTLHNHQNVGPFIGRQLIQRLVTSNPSPAYVAAVSARFANNGSGVRGDMKAVVKAVLMNPEARKMTTSSGKLREPVLKLSAFMRAFAFKSDTGDYRVGSTDDAGCCLGQSPLRSPTVFNFYRPGYVPPGTGAAKAGLAVPEMQLASETSAAGYVNYMFYNIANGVGIFNTTVNGMTVNRRDLQPDYSAELALADNSSALVDRLNARLMYGTMPAALKSLISNCVDTFVIPALKTDKSNQAAVDQVKRDRVVAAIFLTVVSPEFQVQR